MKLLILPGSTRKDSVNKKLASLATKVANDMGFDATYIDLKDYELPLYDGDLEQEKGLPENAQKLRELFFSSDAVLISSAEYNSSLPAVLKNTIDWISRGPDKKGDTSPFMEKPIALLSASPGFMGGTRCLIHLRSILTNIGAIVIPKQMSLSKAQEAFTPDGDLVSESKKKSLTTTLKSLLKISTCLKSR